MTIPNAIRMREEGFGISWKHTDFRTQEVEVRRSRRLGISMICTVGNYEYGFFWYFYNDASIEVEVKLSGVLATGYIAEGEVPRWGKLVAPGVYGPNHQHFFNFRLDMSVDGTGNIVYEVVSIPEPDPELNPHHNAWITRDRLVASEAEGARDWDWKTGRYWKNANPSKQNELGASTAYKLVPKEIVPVMVQEGSYIYDRSRFVQHNLWVTKYDQSEMFAAGDYMYQSADAQGLPEFVADDAPLEDTDVVLWYTLGAHHVVRPEDWLVMPCAYTGFHLKPVGFFDGNPALDIPPTPPKACHGAHHSGLPVAERALESRPRPRTSTSATRYPPRVCRFRRSAVVAGKVNRVRRAVGENGAGPARSRATTLFALPPARRGRSRRAVRCPRGSTRRGVTVRTQRCPDA